MPAGTEDLHEMASGLERRPSEEIASILAGAQVAAADAVRHAIPQICTGARAMAASLRGEGRLVYIGAGSSGLMAAADAMELGGTYGIPPERLRIFMAGGLPTSAAMPGGTEDDDTGIEAALPGRMQDDTVIAVSASGGTPYTLAAARLSKARGATIIGMANNAGSPLLKLSDCPVLLQTPPEVVAGSTRMGAGTAQKIAFNMLSTLMAIDLGHVQDGMMVNLVADNDKLRHRAERIVQTVSGQDRTVSARALAEARGAVKPAILMAKGVSTLPEANTLLSESEGHLGAALARLANT